jgi:Tol biopolymer transport system component
LIYSYNTHQKVISNLIKLCLGLILALLLTGCAGEPTTTTLPTTTQATLTPQSTLTGQTDTTPTPGQTHAVDPVHSVSPVITFPNQTPDLQKTTTPDYNPLLPGQVRPSNPKAELYNPGPGKALPKNTLVVGTDSGLYLLNPTGGPEKLLVGGASFMDPSISPDGQNITAFRRDPLTRQSQLVLVNLGGSLKPVTFDTGGIVMAAAWSPDSKKLALTRATDTNNDGLVDVFDQTSLVLYEVASGKQTALAEGGYGAWSADGLRLAYIIPGATDSNLDPTTRQLRRGPNALGVYNFSTKAKRTLLESKGQLLGLANASFTPIPPDINLDLRYFKSVAWHPDNRHFTASADAVGPSGLRAGVILTITLDDPTPRILTAAGDAASRVTWSPDGKQLAFETIPQFPVTAKSANQVALLKVVSLENSAPVRTMLGAAATRSETRRPVWSPDSQQLAYLSGDTSILTLADATGQNPRYLLAGCQGFDWF